MADKTHDTPKNDKEKLDKKLDQALKDSFPDSDPTSTLVPDRFPPKKTDVAGAPHHERNVPAEDKKKRAP
jgi:hypothetical protein